MIPAPFDYAAPTDLGEALKLLGDASIDSRLLAGGQSLMPLLKLRVIAPEKIVDLCRVEGLTSIRIERDFIEIGAMATERVIELSSEINALCPVLVEAMSVIADPHVRNMGTIGGAICQADPRGDLPACLLALDVTLVVRSSAGTREIPIREFYTGPFSTLLTPADILTLVRIPVVPSSTGAYLKLSRRAGDFAIVGVAALVDWKAGVATSARLALCGAGPMPILVDGVAECVAGTSLDDATIDSVAFLAETAADPLPDPGIAVDYRLAMVRTMVTRALRLTRDRAVGPA